MIAARIVKIRFERNNYAQTQMFQRIGKCLSNNSELSIDAVITDDITSAVKMLRKNLIDYMLTHNINQDQLKWFNFRISTTKIKNDRFSMQTWFEHGAEYPAVGDLIE